MGRFRFVAGFMAGAVLASGAVVIASIPSASGEITACYSTRSGAVRLIDAEAGAVCRSGEVRVSWNQQGDPGPPGSMGGFELVDDDGAELGTVVTEIDGVDNCWIVWDGTDFVSYDSTSGEPCFNVLTTEVLFSDSGCTGEGDIYLRSAIVETANTYSMEPTLEFDTSSGVAFVRGVTEASSGVVDPAYESTRFGCVPVIGDFYKVIGTAVDVAAGPLTVAPAD